MFRYPITITIDTNIFEAEKYDLSENSKLQVLLKHVKEGKVKVVLCDIVLKEVKAHLEKTSSQLYSQIRKNRNQLLLIANENLINTVGLEDYVIIPDKEKIRRSADTKFETYIKELACEILSIDDVNISEIVDDYFAIRPPFQDGEKKRKEFPDAFIVNELKSKFSKDDSLIILSNDKGLIKGCHRYHNYKAISSLDDLLKQISKDDEQYNSTINILISLKDTINSRIKEQINTDIITVVGQSRDSDGIVYGHDYSETQLRSIGNVSHGLHIIDDIDSDEALITLVCEANIEMDCYYQDYDNAPWDSEEKEYAFVETVHVIEKHKARFGVRVKITFSNRNLVVLPFLIYLGGDSRIEVVEVDEDDFDEYDFESENRENLGLQSFDQYGDFADEHLHDSEMNDIIPSLLDEYKSEFSILEDLSITCEAFLGSLKTNDNVDDTIFSLEAKMDEYDFSYIELPDDYTKDEIIRWVNDLFELCSIYEEIEVPDRLEFDHEYEIKGLNDTLIVGIEKLYTQNLSEGDKESASIYAENDNKERVFGSIELTVGYLHFDDNMCATDGEEDNLSIEYSDVYELISKFVSHQKEILLEYRQLEDILSDFCMEDSD